jgi:hypothetical protein
MSSLTRQIEPTYAHSVIWWEESAVATLTIQANLRSAGEGHVELSDPPPLVGLSAVGDDLSDAVGALAQLICDELSDPADERRVVLKALRDEGFDAIEVVVVHRHTLRLVSDDPVGSTS